MIPGLYNIWQLFSVHDETKLLTTSSKGEKKMKTEFIYILFICILAGGCAATKPMVSMEKDVSFSNYEIFEVLPVLNETGKHFEFDVANVLTNKIKGNLQDIGYVIGKGTDKLENTLVIKNSLIIYEPGSVGKRWLLPGWGKTACTVETALIDKKTGEVICELFTVEAVGGGGLFSSGADKYILKMVADGIVNEIDKTIQGD